MKKHMLFTIIALTLTMCVGYILAARSTASFEQAAIQAEMKEAGLQYEAALVQYPQALPKVYALYGHTPELQEVFRKYGHNQIVPIVEKCLDEGDRLLELGTQFDELMSSSLKKSLEVSDVEPAECGWRAIVLTLVVGNDFLGQYVVDDKGKAHVLPGSSVLAILKRLTVSGLQGLERKFVLRVTPTLKEWGFGALDVAVIGIASKAAATAAKRGIARIARPSLGRQLNSARVGIMGFAGVYAPKIAKYATVGGVAYLVLYHPQVITGAAGVLADTLGVAPVLVQTLVWGIILFVPSWILITLLLFGRSVFRLFIFPRAPIQPSAALSLAKHAAIADHVYDHGRS